MEEDVIVSEEIEKKEPEVFKAVIPKLKVVGKIDLDAINSKIKPKRKSKEERQKEQDERIRADKEKRKIFKEAHKEKREEKEKENLPKIGEIGWLEIKRKRGRGKPYFVMANKDIGKIVVDPKNYPDLETRGVIRIALQEAPIGQQLLCKVIEFRSKFIGLRWMIEDDPYAKTFPELNKSKKTNFLSIFQSWFNKLRGR
jgi:hypothetical protein